MTNTEEKKEEKNEENNEPNLDPLTKMSKELDELKVKLAEKDARIDQANKNMTEMMDVNKALIARINGNPNQPQPKPKEKTYDEIMIESAVGAFKQNIERLEGK